jgi:Tol biopolymer transport system component
VNRPVRALARLLAFPLIASCVVPASAAPTRDGADAVFPLRATRVVEFETREGTKMNPDVSPDGRTIVFDLLGDLYALDIAGGTARPLTRGPAVDFRPRYSPDGSKVAFVSDRNGTDNLWVMNADGSDPYMVSSQDPNQHPKDTRFFITPAWTPDGRHVAAAVASEVTFYGADDIRMYSVDRAKLGQSESVIEVPPPNPDTRPVFTAQRPAFPREGIEPEFSRDGRYVYYSVRTELNRYSDEKLMPQYQVGRFDRRTETLSILTVTNQGAFSPRLSPDGRWMVYAVRYDADTGLRLRDLRHGSDRWLLFPVDRDAVETWWSEGLTNAYSFVPDGSAVVTSFEGKLWRVSLPDGKITQIPFTAPVRAELGPLKRPQQHIPTGDTVTVRQITDQVLSPDGRQLAFRALGHVWVKAWPDGVPKRVTRDADGLDDETRPVWSADGHKLLFTGFEMKTLRGGIYERDMRRPSAPLKALTVGDFYYSSIGLTPDGRTVVALRAPVNRDALYLGFGYRYTELVKLPRAGGVPTEVAPVGMTEYAAELQFIGKDSSRVYYFDQDAGALSSVPLEGGARRDHLCIESLSRGATGARSVPTVLRALLTTDGRAILVHHDLSQHDGNHFGQLDWIDLSSIDLRGEASGPVPVTGPKGNVKGVRRLTTNMGSGSPFWSADQREVYFVVADKVFRTTPDAASPPREPVGSIGLTLPRAKVEGVIAFRGARILTMSGEDIPKGDIVVEGARIKAVGPAGSVAIPAGARIIDASGRTIMPGIISTHAHQYEVGETGPMLSVGWELLAKLAYGVTTVLDPAPPLAIYSFSDLTQAGGFHGPRIVQTGPLVSWPEDLDSPADAASLIRRNELYGDCCVKVYDMGGRLNRQWMWNAAAAAGRIPIPETEGSLNASLSYVLDGVPHLSHGLQMPVYDDVRQLFGRSGSSISYQFTALVGNGGPSGLFHFFDEALDEGDARLRQWVPYEFFQQHNRRRLHLPEMEHVIRLYGQNLAPLMDAGMPIHLGEHGMLHGLGNHWNVWALADGAGNRRALQAATIHGAYAVGLEKEIGSIEPGKLADLLVLDGNPMDDIRATEKLRYVMRGGELFDPMTLERIWPTRAQGPIRWWTEDVPRMREGARLSGQTQR